MMTLLAGIRARYGSMAGHGRAAGVEDAGSSTLERLLEGAAPASLPVESVGAGARWDTAVRRRIFGTRSNARSSRRPPSLGDSPSIPPSSRPRRCWYAPCFPASRKGLAQTPCG